ncbi:hypothetical protein ATO11_13475 [Pseudaestuariivita atlantica]|uniref:Uncharacterized protein n=2 Tax=Pseudaestuariivita atlantica TaxID=1317121 RepID=A0A0L1JML3_9RHOB|nr:hypothetical protein ATO11_13475 [Pseudaestuariivita atlantica]
MVDAQTLPDARASARAALSSLPPDDALVEIDAALARWPDDPPILLTRASVLEALQRDGEALDLLQQLSERLPGNGVVRAKLGQRLLAAGRVEDALGNFNAAIAAIPDNVLARSGHVESLAALGRTEEAMTSAREGLDAAPEAFRIRVSLVEMLTDARDYEAALAACDAGLDLTPGNRRLVLAKFALLKRMMQPGRALDALREAIAAQPGDTVLTYRLVQTLIAEGHVTEAEALLAAHADDPAFAASRADLLEQKRDLTGAFDLLETQLGLPADPEALAQAPHAALLKYAELAVRTTRPRHLEPVLTALAARIGELGDPQIARLMEVVDKVDMPAAAAACYGAVADQTKIGLGPASHVLRCALTVMPEEEVTGVARALASRVAPPVRPEFEALTTWLIDGPDAALRTARARFPVPATASQAMVLAEYLIDAGKLALARRYLRRCMHVWPDLAPARRRYIRSCIDSGAIDEGHAYLDRLQAANPEIDLDPDRISLWVFGFEWEKALDLIEAREARGLAHPSLSQEFELNLALGRVERATEVAQKSRDTRASGLQATRHFGTTFMGSRLRELQLYLHEAKQMEAAGDDEATILRTLARPFVRPARIIVDNWFAGQPPRPRGETDIPLRVMQYWNTADIPGDVQTVMQSWKAPGVEHVVYNHMTALSFLRENFSRQHVRAFTLANSVTEECDFLRLCLLFKFGGVYADADDRLVGDLRDLTGRGNGMVAMREIMGPIANNFICARPGHPVLQNAIALAGQSLIQRENDSPWAKTGPGLMTRATALYIAHNPPETTYENLTVIPSDKVARTVQSHVNLAYKSKAGYWNARKSRVPEEVQNAIRGIKEI